MNDFIVWDKRYKVFRKLLKIDFQLGLYFCIDTVVPFEKGELIKNIDLKDTNGKSIYTDSSIVEMVIKHRSSGDMTSIGYFKFNKQYLRYEIIFIDGYMKEKTEFYHGFMSNFKIIDTIQENKLGLIK